MIGDQTSAQTFCLRRRNPKSVTLLLAFFSLIIFSPTFSFGVTVRADEALLLALGPLLVFLLFSHGIPGILGPLIFFTLTLLVAYLVNQVISAAGSVDLSWVRATILGNAFYIYYGWVLWILAIAIRCKSEHDYVLKNILYITSLLSLVSIVQVWDHKNDGTFGVIYLLEMLYPYEGTLDEVAIDKAHGFNLKMGGAGRATGTFNGHPILLGDALAVLATFLIPIVKNKKHVVLYVSILGGLALTLSRGAWVAYIAGSLFYVSISAYKNLEKKGLKINIVSTRRALGLFLGIVFLVWASARAGLLESVTWRIKGTIASLLGEGVPMQRLESVWPKSVEEVSQEGITGWLLGVSVPYEGPTDSQYLLLLVDSGLVGVVAFVSFIFALVLFGVVKYLKRYTKGGNIFLSYSSAMVAVLIASIFHPVLQGNRFFSILVFLSIIVYAVDRIEYQSGYGGRAKKEMSS